MLLVSVDNRMWLQIFSKTMVHASHCVTVKIYLSNQKMSTLNNIYPCECEPWLRGKLLVSPGQDPEVAPGEAVQSVQAAAASSWNLPVTLSRHSSRCHSPDQGVTSVSLLQSTGQVTKGAYPDNMHMMYVVLNLECRTAGECVTCVATCYLSPRHVSPQPRTRDPSDH